MKRTGSLTRRTALARSAGPARRPKDREASRAAATQAVERRQHREDNSREQVSAEARSGRGTARPELPKQRERDAEKRPARKPNRSTGPSATTRTLVGNRDDGLCVRCGQNATNVHHREARGMGGRKGADHDRVNGMAYLLSLCGSGTTGCHGWVESNRTRAQRDGYLLRRNAVTVPADQVPVYTSNGWQRFTDDGHRVPVGAPQDPPQDLA